MLPIGIGNNQTSFPRLQGDIASSWPRRAHLDPRGKQSDLFRLQSRVGRHLERAIVDRFDQPALFRLAGYNRRPAPAPGKTRGAGIEPQFAALLFLAVAAV